MDLDQALSIMKQNGYKYTEKRKDILFAISNQKRYLTVRDVLTLLTDKYPYLSLDTIYRNLALFEELSILEMTELDGERHYRMRCSTQEHHHHFICLGCGKTKEIKACPMELLSDIGQEIQIVDHKFEIYGYCVNCH